MKQIQYKYKIITKFDSDMTIKATVDALENVLNSEENNKLELCNIIECDTFFVIQWQY